MTLCVALTHPPTLPTAHPHRPFQAGRRQAGGAERARLDGVQGKKEGVCGATGSCEGLGLPQPTHPSLPSIPPIHPPTAMPAHSHLLLLPLIYSFIQPTIPTHSSLTPLSTQLTHNSSSRTSHPPRSSTPRTRAFPGRQNPRRDCLVYEPGHSLAKPTKKETK